jgi:hypothetical protein
LKIKRSSQPREAERRRDLAEVNLLVERAENAPASRKGCVLPFIGAGAILLAALAAAAGLAL